MRGKITCMGFSLKERGFTLVEIIIVIAIVSILATVVLLNYGDVKKAVRDKQRVTDIEQIRLALRLYREANGTYPDCKTGMEIRTGVTQPGGCSENINTALAPYMTTIPEDPRADGSTYMYVYDSKYDCRVNGNTSDETVVYAIQTDGMASNWGRNSPHVVGVCEPVGGPNNYYGALIGPETP